MELTTSELAVTHIHDVMLQEGDVLPLKYIWRQIQVDYDNPCEFILKHCNNVGQLEKYLKDYPHLLMIENRRVARTTDELESGRKNADRYFEEEMNDYAGPVKIERLKKHVDYAPKDVKNFIETFYPFGDFRKYLKRRPYSFVTSKIDNTVNLVERESVNYFQKIVKIYKAIRFTSLRGHVGQAPDYVREYINERYPGTEFRYFLENNCHAFALRDNGIVNEVVQLPN